MKNLCDDCKHEFATCEAKGVFFASDLDPDITGSQSDVVFRCLSFLKRKDVSVCMNFDVSDNIEMIQKIEKGIDAVLGEYGFKRTISGKGDVCFFKYEERRGST